MNNITLWLSGLICGVLICAVASRLREGLPAAKPVDLVGFGLLSLIFFALSRA